MAAKQSKYNATHDPDTKRPYGIWHEGENHNIVGRFYKGHQRAHQGALLVLFFAKIGTTVTVYNRIHGRPLRQYTRVLNGYFFPGESNRVYTANEAAETLDRQAEESPRQDNERSVGKSRVSKEVQQDGEGTQERSSRKRGALKVVKGGRR